MASPSEAPILTVDCVEHLDLIESVLGSQAAPVRLSLELDAAWHGLGGRIKAGAKRSPIRTPEQAVALAEEISRRDKLELVALMAYEGQISGVGDQLAETAAPLAHDPLDAEELDRGDQPTAGRRRRAG